jgi:hypothetical protein
MRDTPAILIASAAAAVSGMMIGILISCGPSGAVYENAQDPCKKKGPDVCVSDERGDYHCTHDKEE